MNLNNNNEKSKTFVVVSLVEDDEIVSHRFFNNCTFDHNYDTIFDQDKPSYIIIPTGEFTEVYKTPENTLSDGLINYINLLNNQIKALKKENHSLKYNLSVFVKRLEEDVEKFKTKDVSPPPIHGNKDLKWGDRIKD